MKTILITITPSLAREYLERNPRNRKVSKALIGKLVQEIKNGKWKVNGDCIRFDEEDNLLDGQHRLIAIVKSGVPVQSFATWGLSSDVFNTIDVGKRRSGADTLTCRGEKNAVALASMLILIEKYKSGKPQVTYRPDNIEMEELYEKYPGAASFISFDKRVKAIAPESVINACSYLFSEKDSELATWFFDSLASGIGLNIGEPVYTLRERLISEKNKRLKKDQSYYMAFFIIAWNYLRMGKKLTKLQMNYDEDGKMKNFPEII
jgi:hypothetical protein